MVRHLMKRSATRSQLKSLGLKMKEHLFADNAEVCKECERLRKNGIISSHSVTLWGRVRIVLNGGGGVGDGRRTIVIRHVDQLHQLFPGLLSNDIDEVT